MSCRRSKIKCDRNLPCNNCLRSRHKTCAYEHQETTTLHHDKRLLGETELRQPLTGSVNSTSNAGIDAPAPGLVFSSGSGSYDVESSAVSESNLSLGRQNPRNAISPATSIEGHNSSLDIHSLLRRVKSLESRLAQVGESRNTNSYNVTQLPEVPQERTPRDPSNEDQYYRTTSMHVMPRSVMNKNRYFGQSHWANGILLVSSPHVFEPGLCCRC